MAGAGLGAKFSWPNLARRGPADRQCVVVDLIDARSRPPPVATRGIGHISCHGSAGRLNVERASEQDLAFAYYGCLAFGRSHVPRTLTGAMGCLAGWFALAAGRARDLADVLGDLIFNLPCTDQKGHTHTCKANHFRAMANRVGLAGRPALSRSAKGPRQQRGCNPVAGALPCLLFSRPFFPRWPWPASPANDCPT